MLKSSIIYWWKSYKIKVDYYLFFLFDYNTFGESTAVSNRSSTLSHTHTFGEFTAVSNRSSTLSHTHTHTMSSVSNKNRQHLSLLLEKSKTATQKERQELMKEILEAYAGLRDSLFEKEEKEEEEEEEEEEEKEEEETTTTSETKLNEPRPTQVASRVTCKWTGRGWRVVPKLRNSTQEMVV
jgi:hypothetical protein